jgi:cytochrome c-type biogenesis protein CcsB
MMTRASAVRGLCAVTAAWMLLAMDAYASTTPVDPLRTLAVQDGGRVKPLDTFARESARRIAGGRAFGAESVRGLDPVEWVVAMMADPEQWKDAPIVRVSHAGLRSAVGLSSTRDRYSFRELATHEPFLKAAEAARAKEESGSETPLDPVEREVADLYGNLALMSELFTGEALHVMPETADAGAAWTSWAHVSHAGAADTRRVGLLSSALLTAYAAGDMGAAATAASALHTRLGALTAGSAAEGDLAREVLYNRVKPFRLAWILYLFGFLGLAASFPLASRAASRAGFALVAAAFVLQGYGMLLRMLISGRPPVTNMYESVVFVSWGAVLFALAFEAAYRVRYFAACASGLSVLLLILADSIPILDGSIEPLVPVLRDNMWLTVHVLTITLGYAAFFLGVALGHLNLALYFFAPGRRELLRTMSLFLYRALQAGTLFLAAGTLLGGVWASYSWGRFWGWDPKETWALIALLTYLAILHGRFLGWIRDFGLAVGALLGGLTVLMAWYGVNFILGTGLHSYGFGSGGYAYVGAFVAFEVAVITAAFLRVRAARVPAASAPAASALAAPAR